MRFLNAHRSFEPYNWDEALTFEGGWDAGFARWIFETYNLFELEPSNGVRSDNPEIIMSATAGLSKIALYTPYNFDLALDVDLRDYRCILFDLEQRRVLHPDIDKDNPTTLGMYGFNSDALFIAER
jgi:hypothetical protein